MSQAERYETIVKSHQERCDKNPYSDNVLKLIQMCQGKIPYEDLTKELKEEQELHQQSAQDTEQVLEEIEGDQ
jgi:hypothetical protein